MVRFRSGAVAGTIAMLVGMLAVAGNVRAQEDGVPASDGPGAIHLMVDASQAPQKILHIHEVIPVTPVALTLYYPEWIPGEHMPDGPIIEMAGLKFTAGGKTIAWRRDLVEMYSLHLEVPAGVTAIDADFDFLLSDANSGFSSGGSATASLDVLSWNQVLLYPKGWPAAKITFLPSLKLPAGWKFGTALPGPKLAGDTIEFDAVPLNTLVDSPVLAGRYFRAIQLTPGEKPMHELDIAADSAAALEITPETERHLHELVVQAGALYGSRHYRDYHFLVTLSDDVAHFGLEHHESSDDRSYERSLIDGSLLLEFSGLLPHEYTHSWNGKFRRPAGLATPDYQQPMKDNLLWVYEGLTEYLGSMVLTSRSGLLTEEQTREDLAYLAATYEDRPGRDWRPLQDTADAAPFLYDAGEAWSNWRRGTDFYEEGQMLWLDVDDTLRRLTNDKKSMNDFCLAFHGGPSGEPELKTYTFEDVVATLNGLVPYDWTGFLRARLDGTATKTPAESVENSGWKIVYDEVPNEMEANDDLVRHLQDLSLSGGLVVDDDGTVRDVIHGSAAYTAGLGPGMKIAAVGGQQFSSDALREAIVAAKKGTAPIQLIVANGAEFKNFELDYHGGLRYPHLARDESKPDYLSEILGPLATKQ